MKYKVFWYFPKGDTCLKISSNSDVRLSLLVEILSSITPEGRKKGKKKSTLETEHSFRQRPLKSWLQCYGFSWQPCGKMRVSWLLEIVPVQTPLLASSLQIALALRAREIFCSLRKIYLCLLFQKCTRNHSITYTNFTTRGPITN